MDFAKEIKTYEEAKNFLIDNNRWEEAVKDGISENEQDIIDRCRAIFYAKQAIFGERDLCLTVRHTKTDRSIIMYLSDDELEKVFTKELLERKYREVADGEEQTFKGKIMELFVEDSIITLRNIGERIYQHNKSCNNRLDELRIGIPLDHFKKQKDYFLNISKAIIKDVDDNSFWLDYNQTKVVFYVRDDFNIKEVTDNDNNRNS